MESIGTLEHYFELQYLGKIGPALQKITARNKMADLLGKPTISSYGTR